MSRTETPATASPTGARSPEEGALTIDADGWIEPARRVPSPHFDHRPEGVEVDMVVIHGISLPPGEYGGPWIDRLFQGTLPPEEHPYFEEIHELEVAAHLLIRRDGELVQYVPLHERAWHAGESSFEGRPDCNTYSVGIELEGTDDSPYEDAQYTVLRRVLAAIEERFPKVTRERVVGHSDVAPGRKTDPGRNFSWEHLKHTIS